MFVTPLLNTIEYVSNFRHVHIGFRFCFVLFCFVLFFFLLPLWRETRLASCKLRYNELDWLMIASPKYSPLSYAAVTDTFNLTTRSYFCYFNFCNCVSFSFLIDQYSSLFAVDMAVVLCITHFDGFLYHNLSFPLFHLGSNFVWIRNTLYAFLFAAIGLISIKSLAFLRWWHIPWRLLTASLFVFLSRSQTSMFCVC